MLQTWIQLENLSKDELTENFKNEINTVYSELNNCFKDFKAKYENGELEPVNLQTFYWETYSIKMQ